MLAHSRVQIVVQVLGTETGPHSLWRSDERQVRQGTSGWPGGDAWPSLSRSSSACQLSLESVPRCGPCPRQQSPGAQRTWEALAAFVPISQMRNQVHRKVEELV